MSQTRRLALTQAFRALRLPDYRVYWFGQLASQTGTWMQSLAQSWLVLLLTDSPLALGTVATVQFTPILLLSLFGGVLADRMSKLRLLLITQVIMLAQAAALALLTWSGHIQLWHIYGLAFVLGTANALSNPARQAFVRDLVGPDDLPNAVALNSAQFNLSRVVGPSLGGLVITIVGVAGCFVLNALSYLGVIAALLRLRTRHGSTAVAPTRGTVLGQIGEGIRYALTTPDIALIVLLMGVIGTFGYNFNVVLPLIARYMLNATPLEFGGLTTAMGVGSLLAALGLAYSGRATRQTLLFGAGGFSLLLAAVALSYWWLATIPLLVLLGLCSIVFSTTANTRLQMVTPAPLRGRVLSIYMLLFAGTTPFGSLIIGTVAEHAGVQFAVLGAGIACGLGVVGALVYARRSRARLLAEGAASEAAVETPVETPADAPAPGTPEQRLQRAPGD
jgi:MFS family permease